MLSQYADEDYPSVLGCWRGISAQHSFSRRRVLVWSNSGLMIACEGSLLCVEWQTDGCRRPFPSKDGGHGKNHAADIDPYSYFSFLYFHSIRYQVTINLGAY